MILKHIELYENKGIAKIILKLQNFDYIINEQIIRELEKLCEILSYDDKTKVIVITSEEEHFCIGSNLQNSSYFCVPNRAAVPFISMLFEKTTEKYAL